MNIGYFVQAWKMFQTKSVNDVSPLSFSVFLIGNIVWWAYGISLKDFPLILSAAIGTIGAGLVVLLYFVHWEEERHHEIKRKLEEKKAKSKLATH
ncbi:MAG: SemiSWEET family transporter [Patescibacteria group bacterium]|nr:SemiSWEET family transporter [Patescibacteria group bacterium]